MPLQLLQAQLAIELLAGSDGAPPSRFRVFKKGLQETSKGVFKFTAASAKSVKENAAKYGNKYAIDYNHAMHSFISLDPAESGKAAGWFKLAIHDEEAWAEDVRWTPKGKQKLTEGEYGYFSPVFDHTEDGEIVRLVSVGLTNTPATYEMTPLSPLMASQLAEAARLAALPPTQQPLSEPPAMKFLLAKLGLAENASEYEAVSKLEALLSASTGAFSQLSALTGKATAQEQLSVVQGWKAGFDQLPTLTAELTSLKTSQLEQERTALLSQAKLEQKVSPAMEGALKDMPISSLKAFLAVAPKLTNLPVAEGTAGRTASLSMEAMQIAQSMGVDAKDVEAAISARKGA